MFTFLKMTLQQMKFLTRYGKKPENLNVSSRLYDGAFKFSFSASMNVVTLVEPLQGEYISTDIHPCWHKTYLQVLL
jgi:hypothetical protein